MMMRPSLFLCFVGVPAVCAAGRSFGAPTQGYPSKAVRLIVPTTSGGPADALARALGVRLTQIWGQQVVADNRPGAHGIIAMSLLAAAPPDGYTLLLGSTGVIAINAALYSKLPYDTFRDFSPVMLTTKQPYLLAINPELPARDLRAFIELAKRKPRQLTFGSAGIGSGMHVAVEMFKRRVGIDLTHVPYKGSSPAITDLIAGQINAYMASTYTMLPYVRNGRIRGLAISYKTRLAIAPDIPTFNESGVRDFEVTQWQGILAPAGVSAPLLGKINGDLVKAIRVPEIQELMTREGIDTIASQPAEFAEFIRAESERLGIAARGANVRMD